VGQLVRTHTRAENSVTHLKKRGLFGPFRRLLDTLIVLEEINPRSGSTISEEALKPVPEIRECLHDWVRRHGDKSVT